MRNPGQLWVCCRGGNDMALPTPTAEGGPTADGGVKEKQDERVLKEKRNEEKINAKQRSVQESINNSKITSVYLLFIIRWFP